MKRRALLQVATAGAAGLLAGCLEGEGDPGSSGTPGEGGSPTQTDQASSGGDGEDATGDGTDGETDDEGTAEPTDDGETDGEETAEPTDDGETDGDNSDDETGDGEGEGEETPTDGDDGSSGSGSAGSNAVVDHTFEVGGSECGRGEQRAEVARDGDRVNVDGTIRGRNGCYTAELGDVTYDDDADELTVAVRAHEDGDGEYCQECIVDVHYRASVEFEDGTPATVRVLHDGERVTTA